MFKLCLFDLDDTLMRTGDLSRIREKGKNDNTQSYRSELRKEIGRPENRIIYSENMLQDLMKNFTHTKFGVFTRSPRSYAHTVLNDVYPAVRWDVVIAYEDIGRTKPSGDGIWTAMSKFGLTDPQEVMLIGDGDADILSAYNAGAIAVLDKQSWNWPYKPDNWKACRRRPDMFVEYPSDVVSALQDLPMYLPDLEHRLSGFSNHPLKPRFDQIQKFLPREIETKVKQRKFYVFTCGRLFLHDSTSKRREWHKLTKSILQNKDSKEFPEEWLKSIYCFIKNNLSNRGKPTIVSVVPFRRNRRPRLEYFLKYLHQRFKSHPFPGSDQFIFQPNLLKYKNGVLSQHSNNLNHLDRFRNVESHLVVQTPRMVESGNHTLIIDDVCATGSSLINCQMKLERAGSGRVTLLAITENIGKVVYG